MWVSLYQISFMKKGAYHIVNESVGYAKDEHGAYIGNFVNAVLRNFIRETETVNHRPLPDIYRTENLPGSILPEAGQYQASSIKHQVSSIKHQVSSIKHQVSSIKHQVSSIKHQVSSIKHQVSNLSILYSFPEWLVRKWFKRFGYDETIKLLAVLNKSPEFGIRVNLNRISMDEVTRCLEDKGVRIRKGRFLESALYVDRLTPVLKDELFKKGFIHIQDEASQLAGLSTSALVEKGDIVLDACAGSGTKTEQLKDGIAGEAIVAMDIEIKRLKLTASEIKRVKGDAANSPFKDGVFDVILLDAPCSSFGIISKHPEIKWRRMEKDIAAFGNYQFNLLKSLWRKLKKGGCLVYSVCSFEPEETVNVVERFRKEESFMLENPLPFLFNKNMEYYLSFPHETAMDGFFIARLRKK